MRIEKQVNFFLGACLPILRVTNPVGEVAFIISTRSGLNFVDVDLERVVGCSSTLVPVSIPTFAT